MTRLVFLDIDGVLNDHTIMPNGFTTIQPDKVAHLNRILAAVPDLQIVVSSAWRYHVINGDMTVRGMEMLLRTHGIDCAGRVHGITDPDPETFHPDDHKPPYDAEKWHERGLKWRAVQIQDYCRRARYKHELCCTLDDLPLDLDQDRQPFVQTDKNIGLTAELADEVIRRLS